MAVEEKHIVLWVNLSMPGHMAAESSHVTSVSICWSNQSRAHTNRATQRNHAMLRLNLIGGEKTSGSSARSTFWGVLGGWVDEE